VARTRRRGITQAISQSEISEDEAREGTKKNEMNIKTNITVEMKEVVKNIQQLPDTVRDAVAESSWIYALSPLRQTTITKAPKALKSGVKIETHKRKGSTVGAVIVYATQRNPQGRWKNYNFFARLKQLQFNLASPIELGARRYGSGIVVTAVKLTKSGRVGRKKHQVVGANRTKGQFFLRSAFAEKSQLVLDRLKNKISEALNRYGR